MRENQVRHCQIAWQIVSLALEVRLSSHRRNVCDTQLVEVAASVSAPSLGFAGGSGLRLARQGALNNSPL